MQLPLLRAPHPQSVAVRRLGVGLGSAKEIVEPHHFKRLSAKVALPTNLLTTNLLKTDLLWSIVDAKTSQQFCWEGTTVKRALGN
jgi:hypothetical protein